HNYAPTTSTLFPYTTLFRSQVAYGWWVHFLNWVETNASPLAKLVAASEVVIGFALLLGVFAGIAAFFGLTLNFSYVFSGVAGVKDRKSTRLNCSHVAISYAV